MVPSHHTMPDLGSQLHCTLYTSIVLGKSMHYNYSTVLYSIVLSFFCVLILHCFNKGITVGRHEGSCRSDMAATRICVIHTEGHVARTKS